MDTSYTVVAGDNLWNIAVRFYGQGSLYRIITEANKIANPDLIFPGQVLRIPDLAPPLAPPQPPEPQPPPVPQPQSPPDPQLIEFRILRPDDLVDVRCEAVGFRLAESGASGGGPIMYTVVAGDTLWDIARRFYGDPRRYPEIAAANHIPNPDSIFPGQVFVIPGLAAPPGPTPPPPAPAPVTYTVVPGDALWDIARRFYGDPRRYPEIAAANHIPNSDSIFPGQVLVIPEPSAPQLPAPALVTYTVVSGDVLWDIARRFYGDPRRYPEIAAANQIPNPDLIFPGQVLVIPGLSTPQLPAPDGAEPTDEAKHLVVDSDDAFIVVHFGSQNLLEERDVSHAAGDGVARVLAARESRVVFGAPIGTRIEFSVAGVLRALPTLPLRVSPSATARREPASIPLADLPAVPAPLTEQETAIEAPFRLVISPSVCGAFVHDADATAAPDDPARVELWSTRLAVRNEVDGAFSGIDDTDTVQRIVRALHTRDDDEGTTDPPFMGSLDRDQRRAIVALTSHRSRPVTGAAIEPEPLSVRKLYLSTVGAWIDWGGQWDPTLFCGISAYRHLATMGRDAYVRVDVAGYLFPFGHAATLVTITERRIDLVPGPDPVAGLFTRRFIVLRETVRQYATHDLPFTSATVTPLVTPDLGPPETPQAPFVPAGADATNFLWRVMGRDHARAPIRMTTPLVFVPDDATEAAEEVIKAAWTPISKINISGQEVAMAPAQVAGDTTVRVEEFQLNGTVDREAFTSIPRLDSAQVSIPALTALNGGGAPVKVTYSDRYKNNGFVPGDPAQVFLDLGDARKLDFTGGSENGGGFIQPSVGIQAVSRALGAIGDKNTAVGGALSQGNFDPTQFLAGVLPKLFGLFDLLDLLSTSPGQLVGLDRAPKLIAEKLDLLGSLRSELQRLLAALDRTSTDLATAIPEVHGAAAQSLPALKARTDNVRAELAGAADPLVAAFKQVLAGHPDDAAAQAAAFAAKLAQLDGIVSDPSLPAFARAALEKPRTALNGIAAAAQDPGLAAVLEAAAASVLRFDWHPDIGPWPKGAVPDKQVFIPTRRDGLTIAVEVRATDGQQPRIDVSAQLAAFQLALLPGAPLMSLRFSRIGFRVATGRKPEVDVVFDKMVFEGVLGFIEKLRQVIPFDGFADPPYVDIAPAGVTAGFDLALPSVAVGVFSLENIRLSADCRVPFLGEAVTVGFGFCRKDAPFRLTVMAIGGGGWVAIRLSPAGLVVLEMGLEAGASLSIDLGVASGSVSVMIGVYLRLEGDKGQLTGYFRIRGEVNVLGLASASITLTLSLTYDFDTGKLVGRASLRLEVEVLFFSASVEVSVERRLAGSKGDPKLIEIMPPDRGGQQMWEAYFGAFAVGA